MVVFGDSQDNQTNHYHERQTLSVNNLSTFGVVRKYMNGAVCVESAIDITKNDLLSRKDTVVFRKRISCSCNSEHVCSIHQNLSKHKTFRIKCKTAPPGKTMEDTKNTEIKTSKYDLKLSVASLATSTTTTSTTSNSSSERGNDKDLIAKWMVRKSEEKKRIEESKIYLKEIEEQEKQKRLEQERENFKKWLVNKKKEEDKRKLEREQQLQKEKEREADRQRRDLESKLRYQLWLKRKEEEELGTVVQLFIRQH